MGAKENRVYEDRIVGRRSVCVSAQERERQREGVWVFERKRERERERERESTCLLSPLTLDYHNGERKDK